MTLKITGPLHGDCIAGAVHKTLRYKLKSGGFFATYVKAWGTKPTPAQKANQTTFAAANAGLHKPVKPFVCP